MKVDEVSFPAAVPVLRIENERTMREFYVRFLGFTVLWKHRFEPGMPLYVRIARGRVVLDLSEHYGDGTPGSVVWIPVEQITALLEELRSRARPRDRPAIDWDAPGGPTLQVTDPFGNQLRFCQPTG